VLPKLKNNEHKLVMGLLHSQEIPLHKSTISMIEPRHISIHPNTNKQNSTIDPPYNYSRISNKSINSVKSNKNFNNNHSNNIVNNNNIIINNNYEEYSPGIDAKKLIARIKKINERNQSGKAMKNRHYKITELSPQKQKPQSAFHRNSMRKKIGFKSVAEFIIEKNDKLLMSYAQEMQRKKTGHIIKVKRNQKILDIYSENEDLDEQIKEREKLKFKFDLEEYQTKLVSYNRIVNLLLFIVFIHCLFFILV